MIFERLRMDSWLEAEKVVGVPWMDHTKGIIARDGERKILAGCILNNWTSNSVQAHIWIRNPMVIRAGFFQEITGYVFNVCEREVIVGVVPAENHKALRLDKKIGFREMYRIRDGHRKGEDTVILEARREDLARWLPTEAKDGQEDSAAA